jgi:hypothetical protein
VRIAFVYHALFSIINLGFDGQTQFSRSVEGGGWWPARLNVGQRDALEVEVGDITVTDGLLRAILALLADLQAATALGLTIPPSFLASR